MPIKPVSTILIEAVDEGIVTYKAIAEECLQYMSEDQIAEMASAIIDIDELVGEENEDS